MPNMPMDAFLCLELAERTAASVITRTDISYRIFISDMTSIKRE